MHYKSISIAGDLYVVSFGQPHLGTEERVETVDTAGKVEMVETVETAKTIKRKKQ